MNNKEYNELHKKSINNKNEIKTLGYAGCFGCLKWYSNDKIKEWVDRENTAMCPHCGLDMVIGFKLNDHEPMLIKLKEMQDHSKKLLDKAIKENESKNKNKKD